MSIPSPKVAEPDRDCPLCPRLRQFILKQRECEPGWHNAPVRTFLPPEGRGGVRLLVVGLAPGLRGANRTGRPFTGDYAGDLLYSTLDRHGFSEGTFDARPDDGLQLRQTAITNAVRCVPPQNKPTGAEISTCRRFLCATLSSLPRLQAILVLGKIAHDATVKALDAKLSDHPFRHGEESDIGDLKLFSSYHCSRYNTNTRRLTPEMFDAVMGSVSAFLAR